MSQAFDPDGEPFDDSPALWLLSRRGRRRELVRQAVGWLRGKGHVWSVVPWGVLCSRCGSQVQVSGPFRGSRSGGQGPVRSDFSKMRRLFPECLPAMVYSVHGL